MAPATRQESVVSDPHETAGQHVKEEATQELIDRKRHPPFFILMRGIPPPKGDLIIHQCDQTVIGDGDTVRVRSQVTEDLIGSSQRPLAIHDPALMKNLAQKVPENSVLGQTLQPTVELKFPCRETLP